MNCCPRKGLFLWIRCENVGISARMTQFRGATVVQKGKRKIQVFENQALAFCLVPGAEILLLLDIEVQIDLTA